MKRLQISLEPELDEELGRVARRDGVSKAAVVRRCLKEEIEPRPSPQDDPFFRLTGTFDEKGKGLRPGETIDDVLYGRKTRDDLR